jgi:hypothetical protein
MACACAAGDRVEGAHPGVPDRCDALALGQHAVDVARVVIRLALAHNGISPACRRYFHIDIEARVLLGELVIPVAVFRRSRYLRTGRQLEPCDEASLTSTSANVKAGMETERRTMARRYLGSTKCGMQAEMSLMRAFQSQEETRAFSMVVSRNPSLESHRPVHTEQLVQ